MPLPLKYKYSSSKRGPAGIGREETLVAKIEGELKQTVILATGMDSTVLTVRLFDKEGNLLTNVDPEELTLSTSEDVEAKPFVKKHFVYKTEILPRVKSKSIRIRVDWKEKVMSPEILLTTTIAPLKNELYPVIHEYFQSISDDEISVTRGSGTPDSATDGFSFANLGDNRIVKSSKHKATQRTFNFDYLEQARQNISLEVDDSETMQSLFMFFPRKNVHLVEQLTGTIDVTLPTGEKVMFQSESKEIVDGVLKEGAVDKRKFPDLRYIGKGVVLRANGSGHSPQLDVNEDKKIDLEHGITGSADVLIINGLTGQRCRRPKIDFWESLDVTPIEFKFPTDEEFDHYLRKNCGFSLPKL